MKTKKVKDKMWEIIEHPDSQKIHDECFKAVVSPMDKEQLISLAIKQEKENNELRDKVSTLETIAYIAHSYLYESMRSKKELISLLVKNGFWTPRIKRFKTEPYLDTYGYSYYISAVNVIGETKAFGPIGKVKNTISFSAWVDKRIPIKFWNIYQVPAGFGTGYGKWLIKIPYIDPVGGVFVFINTP